MKITDEMIDAADSVLSRARPGIPDETIRLAIAAALSASPAGVVKPLEWRDVRGDGSLYAGTDIGLAYIASEKAWGFRNYPDQYPVQGGIEAAKSAAFADYSARVMSAIEPAGLGVETGSETHVEGELHLKLVDDHMPDDVSGVVEYLREMACVHPKTGERQMPTSVDDEVFELAASALEKMQDALRHIENPFDHFRQLAADEGDGFDGATAVALASDAEYLKYIARSVLSTVTPPPQPRASVPAALKGDEQ